MEEKKFTLKEIIKVIHQCPIFEVEVEAPNNDEGSTIQNVKTVEISMFLFKLYQSSPEEFEKYVNKIKSDK